jgi:arylsulfatase A
MWMSQSMKIRRDAVNLIVLTVFALSCAAEAQGRVESAQAGPTEKPNFVILFVDDMGYADIGCFGAKGYETPHLDRMADQGMRFTRFYSASPGCSPSRAALLTGCYPQRVGIPGVLGPRSNIGLSTDETTIASMLKAHGYATACFGKWHLGHHPEFLPKNHGFDEYFGLPYSNDMWPWQYGLVGKKRKNAPDLPLIDGTEIIEYNPDQTQLTTWSTERAVDFIRRHSDQPFFLYVPYSMVHVPLYVSDKFEGSTEQGLYGDAVAEIDWSAGEILRTLSELGLDERTFVMITSDNGPWLPFGNHGGSAGPFREGKGTTFEGGMRMPCIMRWPGRIPGGTECAELATTMDLLPTIASIAGIEELPERKIDGKNIWKLMLGDPNATTPHEVFYYYWPRQLQAVQSGKWKLHFPHNHRHQSGAPGNDGFRAGETTAYIGLSLYNLETDPGERVNLSHEYPDVVKRLSQLAEKARRELGDGLRGMVGEEVRPPARHMQK